MDKAAQNTFANGLSLDASPFISVDSTLSNCLNGTILTYEGNDQILQNENGNGRIGLKDSEGNIQFAELSKGYVPVGVKEFKGIIYIASLNPKTGECEVGSFPSPNYDSYDEVTYKDDDTINELPSNITSLVYDEQVLFKDVNLTQGSVIEYTPDDTGFIQFKDTDNSITDDTIKQHRMVKYSVISTNASDNSQTDITEYFKQTGDTYTCVHDLETLKGVNVYYGINDVYLNNIASTQEDGYLQLAEEAMFIKYNCPDGSTDLEVPVEWDSNYIDANYLNNIEFVMKDGTTLTNDKFTCESISYNSDTNLFTRKYSIDFGDFDRQSSFNVVIEGKKGRTKFQTFNKEIESRNSFFNYSNTRCMWGKWNRKYIPGPDYHPVNNSEQTERWVFQNNNWEQISCAYTDSWEGTIETPRKLFWHVSPHICKLAAFPIKNNSTGKGKIFEAHKVGCYVLSMIKSLTDQRYYRSFFDVTELDEKGYIILIYSIVDTGIEIYDLQYYFPKADYNNLDSYGNSFYYDNYIPAANSNDGTNSDQDSLGRIKVGNDYIYNTYYAETEKLYDFGKQTKKAKRVITIPIQESEENTLYLALSNNTISDSIDIDSDFENTIKTELYNDSEMIATSPISNNYISDINNKNIFTKFTFGNLYYGYPVNVSYGTGKYSIHFQQIESETITSEISTENTTLPIKGNVTINSDSCTFKNKTGNTLDCNSEKYSYNRAVRTPTDVIRNQFELQTLVTKKVTLSHNGTHFTIDGVKCDNFIEYLEDFGKQNPSGGFLNVKLDNSITNDKGVTDVTDQFFIYYYDDQAKIIYIEKSEGEDNYTLKEERYWKNSSLETTTYSSYLPDFGNVSDFEKLTLDIDLSNSVITYDGNNYNKLIDSVITNAKFPKYVSSLITGNDEKALFVSDKISGYTFIKGKNVCETQSMYGDTSGQSRAYEISENRIDVIPSDFMKRKFVKIVGNKCDNSDVEGSYRVVLQGKNDKDYSDDITTYFHYTKDSSKLEFQCDYLIVDGLGDYGNTSKSYIV